jgi:guanylate kinase
MLVVLAGVPGVGKSTLKRWLKENAGWQPVLVYTTRQHRLDDFERISVTDEELTRVIAMEGVAIENRLFGNRYVVTRKTHDDVIRTSEPFTLDVSPEFWTKNLCPPQQSVLIMPSNRQQLERQILGSATPNRLPEALSRYDELMSSGAERLAREGIRTIINYPHEIARTCRHIIELLGSPSAP